MYPKKTIRYSFELFSRVKNVLNYDFFIKMESHNCTIYVQTENEIEYDTFRIEQKILKLESNLISSENEEMAATKMLREFSNYSNKADEEIETLNKALAENKKENKNLRDKIFCARNQKKEIMDCLNEGKIRKSLASMEHKKIKISIDRLKKIESKYK
jgi:hypothetical protein